MTVGELKPGDRISIEIGPVTTADLVRYAGASGDFNPIHYDHHLALAAGLDGVIAHGLFVMGAAARVFDPWLGDGGAVTAFDARFVSPVKPGDVVTVTAAVTATGGGADGGEVETLVEGRIGDRSVLSAKATLRLAEPS
jgi:acyl dehydratase